MNDLNLLYATSLSKPLFPTIFGYAFLAMFIPLFIIWIIVKIVNRVDDTVQVKLKAVWQLKTMIILNTLKKIGTGLEQLNLFFNKILKENIK